MIMATPAATPAHLGGLERHTLNLAAALADQFDLHLILDQGYLPACADASAAGVHVYPLDFHQSRWNPRLYSQLSHCLRYIQPELVHAQAGKAATLVQRLRRLGMVRQPIVATLHGTKTRLQDYQAADHLICVSAQQRQQVSLPDQRVSVIANGVPLPAPLSVAERQHWLQQRLRPQWPLLMAVGRLEPVKDFTTLLTAMADLPAELWLAGSGSQYDVLQQQITVLNQQGSAIRLLGHVDEAGRLYQLADLAVLSSEREGFPLVLAEALSMNCPVIGTAVSGLSSWLPATDLAPVRQPALLHDCLARGIADLPALHARQASLFARARHELTITRMAEQTAAIYRQLLSGTTQ